MRDLINRHLQCTIFIKNSIRVHLFKSAFTALLQGIIIIVHFADFCESREEDENKGNSILSLCFIIQLGTRTGL